MYRLKSFFVFFSSRQKQKEKEFEPFSNQSEVLNKYNRACDKGNKVVGMCQAMTNTYLDLILHDKNPTQYLKNDRKFLIKSIREENEALDDKQKNSKYRNDEDHHVFYKNNLNHEDKKYDIEKLNEETIQENLNEKQHMLITFKLKNNLSHEVYIGMKDTKTYRFFDANYPGGEIVKSREAFFHEVIDYLTSAYEFKQNSQFKMGIF